VIPIEKEANFNEWYNDIVEKAELSDKRYPVKGMNVWTPYGWKIMRLVDTYIREELDRTGHDEVCFPLLIPETEFKKEKDHIKGFDSEVYWVTHAGTNELDVRLVVRPTSETAIYPMFSLWVRSHTDLPLKVYQIVNTFRYETKQTRSFIRVREIHFFESHTCHDSEEDAQRQVEEDFLILERIMRKLCVPYNLLRRTDWDKFPGAHYTVGIDTAMPNGRTLQIGSIHHYRTNFSEPYGISFEDADGERRFVHQTTYGMSERLVGAIIGVHGDDKGLVLPPAVAPIQVVIIPIISKGNADTVNAAAKELSQRLQDAGLRCQVDDREDRPGSKYFHWEIRGVPLRLELGMRDIENGQVTYALRHDGQKGAFPAAEVESQARSLLDSIADALYARAWEKERAAVQDVQSLQDPPEKILRFGWCGDEGCGHEIEDRFDLTLLGTPYNDNGYEGECIVCGKPCKRTGYAARSM
jgi:prolyl-tRNA synthetase